MRLRDVLIEQADREMSFDVETASNGKLLGFSIAWGPTFAQSAFFWWDDKQVRLDASYLSRDFVMHNAKYDAEVMLNEKVRIWCNYDTYAAARMIFYHQHEGFGLKELCEKFFNLRWGSVHELLEKYGGMEHVPRPILEKYSRTDAYATMKLRKKLGEIEGARARVVRIESRAAIAIAQMEHDGIGFDVSMMDAIKISIRKAMRRLEKKVSKYFRPEYLSSNDSLATVLFSEDYMGLSSEGLPMTPTGRRVSVKGDLFDELRERHEVFGFIADWKRLEKLRNTYTDSYLNCVYKNRIHSTFNQFGANTGRMSSSSPNLQNIPGKSGGVIIAKAFVARPGYRILLLDLRQIELIILGAFSKDPTLTEYIMTKQDIHRLVASVLYGVPLSRVTAEQRGSVKPINFGRIYGGGPYLYERLFPHLQGKALEIACREADRKWLGIFPGVKEYQSRAYTREMQTRGYNQTWFGRRRVLKKLNASASMSERSGLARLIINGDIQGTGGDVHKIGMANAHQAMVAMNMISERRRLRRAVYFINAIHDSLMFEVREDLVKEAAQKLGDAMTHIPGFPLPVQVEAKVGKNWYDMEVL